jgi:hypothetical protein
MNTSTIEETLHDKQDHQIKPLIYRMSETGPSILRDILERKGKFFKI